MLYWSKDFGFALGLRCLVYPAANSIVSFTFALDGESTFLRLAVCLLDWLRLVAEMNVLLDNAEGFFCMDS